MGRVTSKDGTSIAYDRSGAGPAVVLVGGAFVDRSENAPLAGLLAQRFTVYNYDRRGRGESGDTLPYALDREIEDVRAMIDLAGGWAHLYGISSGGALVLEAAASGVAVDRIVVYEVPYDTAEDAPQQQREYVERLHALLDEGRRGDAAALFMKVAGASEEMIARARDSKAWSRLEALAPTLAYDAACLGDGQPPIARLATIRRPTLVVTGGASTDSFVGGGGDFFDRTADAIAASMPRARRHVIGGQTHMVDPAALAPVVERFLTEAVDAAVWDYIDAIPVEHRPLFDRVHRLILRAHPDVEIALSYGMPTYKVGRRRLHVGVWRHGVSLYGWRQGSDGGFTARYPELVTSKGTIQLQPDTATTVPDQALHDLVRGALEVDEPVATDPSLREPQ